ncbi:ornithine decarboxylase, putative [Ixodes scapularis]|uniref:ornithine decarboxylase n=1 Tax=Ixodes scapularis TaxID=6945 RepID=B7QC80_IXOSC|nr:ornithine decarboxylase, putative [Ixodes scapularis]|eukprot:XP_002413144.1 ornithine decarboxylase, putative [Ixodes scapularis]
MKSYPTCDVVNPMGAIGMVDSITSDPDNDQPFFVVDVADIVYKIKLWKLKIPRVEPFYAVKCNSDAAVLELMAGLGLGFDCASKAEIDVVRSLGVSPSRIIYANPCKTKSFIKHAAAQGVDLMTFDNEQELYKVKELFPLARLVIRIRVDDSGSVCQLGLKFGCEVSDAQHLLTIAKSLGLSVVGVSFHVGSNSREPMSFARAIESARLVFDQGLAMGFPMELLDIGGGYPGDRGFQKLFDKITQTINGSLALHFPEETGVRVISEPGRFFVASAFTLYTTVIAKREVLLPGSALPRAMYYLNDGVYGSFNCTVFDHAEPVPFALRGGGPLRPCSLWGPTCDSMDQILEEALLPDLGVGDWVVFENMGAYTLCASSNFNGFQVPEVKYALTYASIAYLREFPFWEHLSRLFEDQQEAGLPVLPHSPLFLARQETCAAPQEACA